MARKASVKERGIVSKNIAKKRAHGVPEKEAVASSKQSKRAARRRHGE